MKTRDWILLAIVGYLLWKQKQPVNTVSITGPQGPISQTCYDYFGQPYELPVSSGPCPLS